jgi:hypothetical protein
MGWQHAALAAQVLCVVACAGSTSRPPEGDAGLDGDAAFDASVVEERVRVALPESVTADCSADVTAPIQAAFDALEAGETLVFPVDGCFRVDRTVILEQKTDVAIEGNGSRFLRTAISPMELRYPKANIHLRVLASTDVAIRGLTIESTNDGSGDGTSIPDSRGDLQTVNCHPGAGCYTVALEFEAAFHLRDSTRVLLEDCAAKSVWGDGVYMAGNDGVTVRRVTVEKNGRQGMAITRGTDTLIEDSAVVSSVRGSIDLEPNKTEPDQIDGVEIRRCTLASRLLAFPSGGGGEVSNVFIHHNLIEATGSPWVYGEGNVAAPRVNWRIEDNEVVSPLGSGSGHGTLFRHTRGVILARNKVPMQPGRDMVGVDLGLSSEADVRCNHFPNALSATRADESSTAVAENNALGESPPPCFDP